MFPFFWVFLASVKETEYLYGPHAFDVIVPGYTLDNYVSVFVNHPFGRYLLNSLTVAGLTMLYSLFVASFAAYAIARLQFFGKNVLFGCAAGGFHVSADRYDFPDFPVHAGYRAAQHVFGTYYSVYDFCASVIDLVHDDVFFKKIPYELEEAAKVDGASIMQTFRKILLPLAAPGLFTTAIIVFVDAWHEFFLFFNNQYQRKHDDRSSRHCHVSRRIHLLGGKFPPLP